MNEETEEELSSEEDEGEGSWFWTAVIVFASLYVGGWGPALGQYVRSQKALILGDAGVLVRFNDLYYGLSITERFFDSPLISRLCLIPLLSVIRMVARS